MNPIKIQHHDKQEEVGWVCLYVWFRLAKFLFYFKNTSKQRLDRHQENQSKISMKIKVKKYKDSWKNTGE